MCEISEKVYIILNKLRANLNNCKVEPAYWQIGLSKTIFAVRIHTSINSVGQQELLLRQSLQSKDR